MLALSVLPVLAVRGRAAEAEIRGGLFQDFAPSAFHLQHVIVPLLAQLGLAAQIETIRPGYPPAGQGIIGLAVPACEQPLCPLTPRRDPAPARVWGSRWHPTLMTGRRGRDGRRRPHGPRPGRDYRRDL